jgi:hypothetical protein
LIGDQHQRGNAQPHPIRGGVANEGVACHFLSERTARF